MLDGGKDANHVRKDLDGNSQSGGGINRIYPGTKTCLTTWLVTCLVVLTLLVAGCIESEPEPETVLVTFEIQLINARADSYGYGIVGGKGSMGFGGVNEVKMESFYADVGDEVFAEVYGAQWSSEEPGHQVICRILVRGEEIYLDADQGTSSQDTHAECRGPVYIPPTSTPGSG